MSQMFSQLTSGSGAGFKRARSMSSSSSRSSGGIFRRNATFTQGPFRKRVAGKGRVNAASMRRIARQVMLGSQEVKYLDSTATNQTVGQVNVDASGHNTTAIAITPVQGTSVHKRVGDSITGDRMLFTIQYSRMVNSAAKIPLQHYVVAFFGSNPTVVIADFLSENLALGSLNIGTDIYDTGCFRDPQFKSTVKVLGVMKHNFDARVATDGSADNVNGGSRQFEVDLKNLKIHYDTDSGVHSNVTIALITLAGGGNRGVSGSTLLGLVNNTQTSGVTMQIATRFLYRDA